MKKEFISKLYAPGEASQFSSYNGYDDEDGFDPDLFDGFDAATGKPVKRVIQIQEATFDLVITNTSAAPRTVELFNCLRSFVKKRNANYAGGNFNYIPGHSLEGQSKDAVGVVGFVNAGDLVIAGATATLPAGTADISFGADGGVRVACSQFPYVSLFESSALQPFKIKRIRQTSVTDEQIDQPIVWFYNSFLGGNKENTYNPRTFFRPEQFQNKIVDIPLNGLTIDGQSGLRYIINNGETVRWNVTIQQYKRMTIR